MNEPDICICNNSYGVGREMRTEHYTPKKELEAELRRKMLLQERCGEDNRHA